ncbi:MAG TPA: cupin domain-containing protein [Kaistia sp.]|nr:cupin domain-containing protein [Kaistia sp.]
MADERLFATPGGGTLVPLGTSTRRVLVDLPELMLVEFTFEAGGIGALHAHPHVQSSYVAEGRFEVTIGDVTKEIAAGGAFIVPSGVAHGVKALVAGRLVDSFTPRRDDFL